MSASQVNIALEKKLMQAMQENETLSNRIKRMNQKSTEQRNVNSHPGIDNTDMPTFHTTRGTAPRTYGQQSSNMGTKLHRRSHDNGLPDRENLGKRMSDILIGALRASKQDRN